MRHRNNNTFCSLLWATVALALMFAGAIGTNILPRELFGIPERFSVFAATSFNDVLGIYLFEGFGKYAEQKESCSTEQDVVQLKTI